MELTVKDEYGRVLSSPPWQLILSYEYKIRRKAYRFLQDDPSLDFGEALKQAYTDPTIKERCFTTPLALQASSTKRSHQSFEGNSDVQKAWKTSAGKSSKGKGKGGKPNQGKGGKGAGKCQSKDPNGNWVCFGYNDFSSTRCRNPRCSYEHICGLCFGKHPMYACNPKVKKQTQGETQGEGPGKK